MHGPADPDPHQNVMDPQHWLQINSYDAVWPRLNLFPSRFRPGQGLNGTGYVILDPGQPDSDAAQLRKDLKSKMLYLMGNLWCWRYLCNRSLSLFIKWWTGVRGFSPNYYYKGLSKKSRSEPISCVWPKYLCTVSTVLSCRIELGLDRLLASNNRGICSIVHTGRRF